jgi:chromosome segregation ATPase
VTQAKQAFEQARAAYTSIKTQYIRLEAQAKDSARQADAVRARLESDKAQLDLLEKRQALAAADALLAERQLAVAQTKVDQEAFRRAPGTEPERAEVDAAVAAAEKKLEDEKTNLKYDDLVKDVAEADAKNKAAKEWLTQRQRLAEVEVELATIRQRVSDKEKERQTLDAQQERVAKERDTLEAQRTQLEVELKKLSGAPEAVGGTAGVAGGAPASASGGASGATVGANGGVWPHDASGTQPDARPAGVGSERPVSGVGATGVNPV